ncbi:MAG: SH3 domain-containing protein [Epsilonproteobacteria bacterium]|nr:SH3 domain-containing protein [Campylobacterota bacterium]MBD3839390.1 SH3 domain-containing protein [Campylobacterota bacterium]
MKRYLLPTILTTFLFFIGCENKAEDKEEIKKEQIVLVNENRHLNIPQFWLSKIKNPNAIIMDKAQIERFNQQIRYKNKTTLSMADINSTYTDVFVKSKIDKLFNDIAQNGKFFEDNSTTEQNFFNEIRSNSFISTPILETRFAITTSMTNEKLIPTDRVILKEKGDIKFDRNQNDVLDIATPLAVLHTSKDNLWSFILSPSSFGWVKNSDIAFGTKEEINEFINNPNFIVTTSPKSGLTSSGVYHDYVRMGVRLPFVMENNDTTTVFIPFRDGNGKFVTTNAELQRSDIHHGYLDYTQKNIIIQGFKFLNQPYSWGDKNGGIDCSSFIRQVFLTVGIELPRNSLRQSEVGDFAVALPKNIDRVAKQNLIKNLSPNGGGTALLHLAGHIVLYLGENNGTSYILHSVWGEGNRTLPLARVAVTPIEFNDYIDKIDSSTQIK